MSTNVTEVKKIDAAVWRAKDRIAELKAAKPADRLFDEFWREGELALFFGPTGKGKSVLAVQIADALARGTAMHGFAMPKRRKKVLYVDLAHSDAQFLERYRKYKFAHELFRGQPDEDVDLFEWIKAVVETNDIEVVIVDDLAAVKQTNEGVRETLLLMRNLKRLCRSRGLSVLAISDASEPKNKRESEKDLNTSKVLCRVADSVFSIGSASYQGDRRRIAQTKSRSGKLFWDLDNSPKGDVKRFDSGLLGFEFDERFAAKPDKEKCRLINDIHWRHEDGQTFRAIAKELGMPTSTLFCLSKKWTPAMGGKPEPPKITYEPPFYDDPEPQYSEESSIWLDIEREQAERRANGGEDVVAVEEAEPDTRPPKPSSIYDLELDFDSYAGKIYVESRDEFSRKPTVWYKPADSGPITKCTRKHGYINVEVFKTDPITETFARAGP